MRRSVSYKFRSGKGARSATEMRVRRKPSDRRLNRLLRARFSILRTSASGLYGFGAIASILGGRPHYIHFGWFLVSVANLVVIVLMIVVFVLALVLPFPHGREKR